MKDRIPTILSHPSALMRDGLCKLLSGTRFRVCCAAADFDGGAVERAARSPTSLWIIFVDEFEKIELDQLQNAKRRFPGLKIVVLSNPCPSELVLPLIRAGVNGLLDANIKSERLIKCLEVVALGETVLYGHLLLDVKSLASTSGSADRSAATRTGCSDGAGMALPDRAEIASPPHTELKRSTLSAHFGSFAAIPSPAATASAVTPAPSFPTRAEGECWSSSDRRDGSECVMPLNLSRREMAILRMLTDGSSNKVIARQLVITEATVKVHIKSCLRKLRLKNRTQAAMWAIRNVSQEATGAATALEKAENVITADARLSLGAERLTGS